MDYRQEFLNQLIVLDTETTGKDYKTAEVTELGYCIAGTGTEHSWEKFDELYKPDDPITPENAAITNISNAMVVDCPSFVDKATEFQSIISAFGNSAIGVAHNAFYDQQVIKRYGVIVPNWLCTLRLARKLFADDATVTAHNLPYLRYRFEILDPAYHKVEAHRADSDAHVTALFLEHCLDLLEEQGIIDPLKAYFPQITAWIDEPIIITTMPFGKHKGKKLAEVPLSYWQWAFQNMDSLDENAENFDKDFALSVEKALDGLI